MCQCTPTPVSGHKKDPVNMRAARIASLAAAANIVLTGSGLRDPRHAETIALDLMDVAGLLATELSSDTENLDYPLQGA